MQFPKRDTARRRTASVRAVMTGAGLAALSILVVACGGTRPQTDDLKYVGLRYEGPAEIEADRLMYEARCGVCHVAFHPKDFRRGEWPAFLSPVA